MKKLISMLLALVMALSSGDARRKERYQDRRYHAHRCRCHAYQGPEQIKAAGVLTVAPQPRLLPPWSSWTSKTGQDQYVGFDITLAKYIAENLRGAGHRAHGLRCQPDRRPHRRCAHVHLRLLLTEDRAQNYELSDYYYAGENETRQALLIKKENADKYTSRGSGRPGRGRPERLPPDAAGH